MPLSLNNSKDIVANSISVIKGNQLIDLLTSLGDKVDTNATYTRAQINTFLDAKVDDTEMANYFSKTVDPYTNEVSIYIGNNLRILASPQDDSNLFKLKFQIFDNYSNGRPVSNSWVDLSTTQWNTITGKVKQNSLMICLLVQLIF